MQTSHQNERSNSALDSLEHELYNPKNKMDDVSLHHVRERRTLELPTSWGDNAPIITEGEREKGLSFGAKFLIFSMLLLLGALGFSGWSVLSSRNVVTTANIDMNADIVPYVEGGESVPVTFTLQNKNVSALQEATISLEYKQGLGSQDEQEKVYEKRELGTIKPNEFKQQNFDVVLYGSEAESRDLVFKLEYKVAGSAALFSKKIIVSTVLKTPPVTIHIDSPKILSVDQQGTFVITVKNNSATTSLQSVLSLILPNTFTVVSATPKPNTKGYVWSVPPLKSGETFVTTIVGSLGGSKGETSTIKAQIGSIGKTPTSLGVVYSFQTADIKLRDSPLAITLDLETAAGSSGVIRYGDNAMLTISYQNKGDVPLQNVVLKMDISGDAPLLKQIDPMVGLYDSSKSTITWNKIAVPELGTIQPKAQGTFRVRIPIALSGANLPALKVLLSGVASTVETDDVVTALQKTWTIQGSVTLSAKTQYKTSPFNNSGPIPPIVNSETTYTVHLVASAQNDIANTFVLFTLPSYVTWQNTTSDDQHIKYDAKNRTVTWIVGQMNGGETSSADILLSVTPTQTHVGSSPSITSGIVLNADEVVSRAKIRTTISAPTTRLTGETWDVNPSRVVDK